MISDTSCLVGMTAQQMAESPPIQAAPPARHFDPPTQAELDALSIDRAMLDVTTCGADVGKIIGVVAVDGVPFRTAYGDLISPNLANVNVAEINDRRENVMRVDRDGTIEETPAGKFRFGHSPDYLDSIEELRAFHDHNEGTLARFRLYPTMLAGKLALVLKGSVLASVMEPGQTPRPITFADLDQLQHAETSPEWFDNYDGSFTYIAHSLVGEGNTNMYTDAERAHYRVAAIRKAKPMTEPAPETAAPAVADHAGCDTCTERDNAARAEAEAAKQEQWDTAMGRIDTLESDLQTVVTHMMERQSATA